MQFLFVRLHFSLWSLVSWLFFSFASFAAEEESSWRFDSTASSPVGRYSSGDITSFQCERNDPLSSSPSVVSVNSVLTRSDGDGSQIGRFSSISPSRGSTQEFPPFDPENIVCIILGPWGRLFPGAGVHLETTASTLLTFLGYDVVEEIFNLGAQCVQEIRTGEGTDDPDEAPGCTLQELTTFMLHLGKLALQVEAPFFRGGLVSSPGTLLRFAFHQLIDYARDYPFNLQLLCLTEFCYALPANNFHISQAVKVSAWTHKFLEHCPRCEWITVYPDLRGLVQRGVLEETSSEYFTWIDHRLSEQDFLTAKGFLNTTEHFLCFYDPSAETPPPSDESSDRDGGYDSHG